MEPLSAGDIRDALDDLAERLASRGMAARIYVVVGAAMALMYDEIVARVFPGEQFGPRQTRWVQEIVRSANDDGGSSS